MKFHSINRDEVGYFEDSAGNGAVVAGASTRPDFNWTSGGVSIHALQLLRTNIRVYQLHNDMNIFCLLRECIIS